MSLQNTQTNLPINQAYNSVLLAFPATGSFTLRRALPAITMNPSTILLSADVSGSLQINIPKSYFTLNSATDSSGNLVNNSISFTSSQLKEILSNNVNAIASVGSLTSIFIHYENYVKAYFGNTTGFTLPYTLQGGTYDSSSQFIYNNNVTTGQNPTLTPIQVSSILTNSTDLSGSLTISNLTSLLTFVCTQNTFDNRNNSEIFTNGFIEGDLIYFSSGIEVKLQTNINNNGILKISSASTSFNIIDNSFNTLHDVSNTTGKILDYQFSNSINNIGTSNLNLTVNVPLLLRITA